MNSEKSSGHKAAEILIAEDSPTQAAWLRHLLEEQGYVVTAVANGRLALEQAHRHAPVLIITDVVMPEMDGYAFCKAVKSDPDLKHIPVIIMTSLSDVQDILNGMESGADNFIRKPYDAGNLLSRVR